MIRLAPDDPSARHNFAVCLLNAGRLDDARVQIEEARRLGDTINVGFDSLLRNSRNPIRR